MRSRSSRRVVPTKRSAIALARGARTGVRMILTLQELGPAGPWSSGRGIEAGTPQDLPDSGGADLVAEAGEFAVDASVAPRRVLRGQADGKGTEAGGEWWSTERRCGWVVQPRATNRRCQRSVVAGVTSN